MSRVVSAITATRGDRHRIIHKNYGTLFPDVFSVTEHIKQSPDQIETEYRIEVRLGSQCWVGDNIKESYSNALTDAVTRTKRQVIEAIFGEFREDFRMIERALYDRNVEQARIALHDMEQKMFYEE